MCIRLILVIYFISLVHVSVSSAADGMAWVHVRPLVADDITQMRQLNRAMTGELYVPWLRLATSGCFGSLDSLVDSVIHAENDLAVRCAEGKEKKAFILIIEHSVSHDVIGFIRGFFVARYQVLIVRSIYIVSAYRRRGILRYLVSLLPHMFPAMVYCAIEVLRHQVHALAAYAALGFKEMSSVEIAWLRQWFPATEEFRVSDDTAWECVYADHYVRLLYAISTRESWCDKVSKKWWTFCSLLG